MTSGLHFAMISTDLIKSNLCCSIGQNSCISPSTNIEFCLNFIFTNKSRYSVCSNRSPISNLGCCILSICPITYSNQIGANQSDEIETGFFEYLTHSGTPSNATELTVFRIRYLSLCCPSFTYSSFVSKTSVCSKPNVCKPTNFTSHFAKASTWEKCTGWQK